MNRTDIILLSAACLLIIGNITQIVLLRSRRLIGPRGARGIVGPPGKQGLTGPMGFCRCERPTANDNENQE